ncbi:DUF4127 family protein [Paenibacillus humicola]|uniref:DUF4127 family protein n=1 Tax=Paenibacillus humicola TaxID=3110540 RepID=UPI00237A771D|nr:DUF4127 family protein [Paenibacillus humicola]
MPRIVYLPLDERPCNARFPLQIAAATELEPVSPPLRMLGAKKRPADTKLLAEWLLEETAAAHALIVSLDMLVYGGIVPSRLHRLSAVQCRARLQTIVECKKRNPKLRIYAFNLIMRAPAYSSSDEEPDYYAQYGAEIARNGWLQDKQERDGLSEAERQEWERLLAVLPREVLSDFTGRRQVNAAVNRMAVQMADEGWIDMLVVPLDDNARFGYSSAEQRRLLLEAAGRRVLDRVHLYPGADEVGCTLFARVFCDTMHYRPNVFVRYSSTAGLGVIPKYEDRSLGESVKSQLTAAGCAICDHASEADVVLMIHSPPVGQHLMAETSDSLAGRNAAYFSEVNVREFAHAIRRYAEKGATIALADAAVCNGADTVLMELLSGSGLLKHLSAYAGWNTAGNTLGTVIAHAVVESYYRKAEKASPGSARARNSEAFLLSRFVEDWGYQAILRSRIAREELPGLGGSTFDVSAVHDEVAGRIRSGMLAFIERELRDFEPARIRLERVELPWKRMFEVGFELRIGAD